MTTKPKPPKCTDCDRSDTAGGYDAHEYCPHCGTGPFCPECLANHKRDDCPYYEGSR
jgi:hypothetical protein